MLKIPFRIYSEFSERQVSPNLGQKLRLIIDLSYGTMNRSYKASLFQSDSIDI